ncbi:phage major capsid protein [Lactobacillus reuteri]|uniref:Phage major capsid protein n=1 Tax=Limosilactobacillus reuteri TaxID=1598 RepID=A0AAW9ZF31_LIMRT|nr:phage major capsid protein [Limosilactobacillus reuteri]NME21796.1 phage major capsid protein [Limosilactobacillus reuteri]
MITTNKKNLNIRTISTDHNQLRAAKNDDGTTTISGYAVTFNQPSQPIPFIEYIDDHALDDVDFSKTLLLYGHDFNKILARADSHTLNIKVDQHGLFFTATLADTTLANDVREDVIAGNLKGCSFGFNIAPNGDSWDTDKDGNTIHYVNKISNVAELTITPIPAYTSTSVQVERDLKEYLNNKEDNMQDNNSETQKLDAAQSAESAAVSADKLNELIRQAVKSAVSNICVAKRDDDVDDGSDVADDTSDDVDESDDENSNSATPASTASVASSENSESSSSSASSESSEDNLSSAVASSAVSSVASSENRSINIKEENTHMINVTPNSENKKEQQLRDFAHYLVTREVRPSLQQRDGAAVQGVGLTQGSVLIPQSILSADHETHQFPRMEQYVHSVNVSTTTGKQPYFEKNSCVLQTKAEFDHAKDVQLSALKFINWDLKTYAGKLALSRELLMDSDKGSTENWLAEAQSQMKDLQDNTNDQLISTALQAGSTVKNATDAIADLKTVLNVNLKPNDSANAQIVLTQSAYNALDQLKDSFGRPLLQPDPTSATSNLLFGKPVVKVDDTLFGKAGDAIAVIAPLKNVIYDFQMGQVTGQFIDNYDIFDTTLGVFLRKDVVNGRPDLVNILKLTDKSLAASTPTTVTPGK